MGVFQEDSLSDCFDIIIFCVFFLLFLLNNVPCILFDFIGIFFVYFCIFQAYFMLIFLIFLCFFCVFFLLFLLNNVPCILFDFIGIFLVYFFFKLLLLLSLLIVILFLFTHVLRFTIKTKYKLHILKLQKGFTFVDFS